MGVMQEFMDFLKEYKVTGLAVAFIIGVAVKKDMPISHTHQICCYKSGKISLYNVCNGKDSY